MLETSIFNVIFFGPFSEIVHNMYVARNSSFVWKEMQQKAAQVSS